jgi:hypothetical protein
MRFTMDMAATAASPYIPARPLRIMVARLPRPCRSRLGKPVEQMRRISFMPRGTRLSDMRLWVLPRRNAVSSSRKLTPWDRAVDRPAPATPMCSRVIRNQSPKMFSTPPAVRPTMAKAARPS